MRAKEFESVNSEVFTRGFEKTKPFGKYTMVAKHGYLPYVPGKFVMKSEQFRIETYAGKSMIGWVNFEKIEDHLEAIDVVVDPKYRRKGIATAMYHFAKELGNDIKASSKQTGMGKQLWATKSPVGQV